MPIEQLAIKKEILPQKNITLFHLTGNLDAHTFELLQDALNEAFSAGRYNILLNVSEVPYMSSAGAGVLIGGFTEAENNGGKLVIYGMRSEVRNVFSTLGILDFFPVFDDRNSAVEAV
ncbi:MAG TPA: STAS domain-containing protein [Planctomycetota bacterium]|nr:STAS domain-containing protein [Planctomycetota bacterium]